MLNIAALLITLSALFSYLNYRYLKLPMTIGLMIISLIFSLVLVALGAMGFMIAGNSIEYYAKDIVQDMDFNYVLMQGMLSFLLFAGALHINLEALAKKKWVIGILASVGVLCSTLLIGSCSYFLLQSLGFDIAYIYCLLFGALISPTDPIAVLGILKTAKAPKSLEIKIAGESLFNDGVGVVIFIVLMTMATGKVMTSMDIVMLFLMETLGGGLLGVTLGWMVFWMLKRVDDYTVEVLLTVALVMGGYALATALHVSGPIVMVVAGLLIGNHGRLLGMSKTTRQHLDMFWELLDEILNAVLFVMIGLEVIILSFTSSALFAALLLIPIVLFARLLCVAAPIKLFSLWETYPRNTIRILTWGGLRGGISVALALSLPNGAERDLILVLTYIIVAFSIIVQGLSIGKVIQRSL